MKHYVIIVAGGKGMRMGNELPKQFLPIGGKPILMRTMELFHRYDPKMDIILVLPSEQQEFWKLLCEKHNFAISHLVADGGDSRFSSVKNGLNRINGDGIVAVHDGVRPFVSLEVIGKCFDLAAIHQAVIPTIEIVETVRHLNAKGSETVPRGEYRLVQTPQVFAVDLLKKAYSQTYTPLFTDDASVVEAMGVPVYLTEGNRENIKITTPSDLQIGEFYCNV